MNQLLTPENINSISETVDSMLNNNQGNSNSPGNFNFGNLLGNIMNSFDLNENQSHTNIPTNQQNQQQQPQQQPQQTQEKKESEEKQENKNNNTTTNNNNINDNSNIFKKLFENAKLRKETKVGDEKIIGEEMAPNIEFTTFSNDIISNLTIEDIFNMYNLNFGGLARMRKDIKSKYFGDKSKNDDIFKNIVELLCERFILIENQLDKLIPGKEFILEDFFNKELKNIINMFMDDNEINLSDDKWEEKFRNLVIDMFKKLINEIKNIYETGEEGAKIFIEYNITTLIENFIGQKYLNAIEKYDDNVMNNFVENLFNIIKTEEIKNKCNCEKKENKNDEKKEEKNDNNNVERPSLLSIDEIFKIANKDKDRLEKEDKENPQNKGNKKYSDFYYLTSLFKN